MASKSVHERQAVTWTREQPTASGSPTGRFAAYAALALVLLGLPLLAVSETGCRWNAAANNYTGHIGEPGATAGPLAFLLGPLLAIVALVLLSRAARRHDEARPRLPVVAAIAVFPLALANFLFWLLKGVSGAFACGFF